MVLLILGVVHAGGLSMLDARSGRLYLADATTGTISVIDGKSGRLRASLQLGHVPTAVVDGSRRRVLIFTGNTGSAGDAWAWVPGWLRRRVPLLAVLRVITTGGPDHVIILDVAGL